MNKELIIRSSGSSTDFALLIDGKLIELHKEKNDNDFSVGDVFIARVKKTVSGLNAAFVDVGYDKDGFLHYHDLGPQINSLQHFVKSITDKKQVDYLLSNTSFKEEIEKEGNMLDVLEPNQNVLVQISKEPISTKGPRISSELSIAGRYIVLVPFSNRISISQKISSYDEKDRLRKMVKNICPKGFGVIVRTVAQDRKLEEIEKDLEQLLSRWKSMCRKIRQTKKTPNKVLEEIGKASSLLRDLFNDSFTSIIVDNEHRAKRIRELLNQIAPHKTSIVKVHQGQSPIFEKYNIERQIKTGFGKTVSLSKGAYLVIEHTEAMHVIDVNSGNRSNKLQKQDDTALEVNLISATEIARQLRLRDMGGIIVVDFIDMRDAEHRKTLYNHLKEAMKEDRARHKILPPSKFGLIQITRQRVRPEMSIKTTEPDPNGNTKEVEPPIVLVDKITGQIERLLQKQEGKITLNVHPFIAAYLSKGVISIQRKWFLKHKRWVKILPRHSYRYLEYHFYNQKGKRIR